MEQREIKFRAFTREGEMIPVGSVELFIVGGYRVNDEIPIAAGHLMQFTGLRDKAGKEIYEGDVLEGEDPWQAGPCVVEWAGSGFVKSGPIGDAIRSVSLRDGNAYFKVIGNIYENPDLLK